MAYTALTQQNPLRVLNMSKDSQMGLVMARAGLGKTALLVQIALDAILRGKRVGLALAATVCGTSSSACGVLAVPVELVVSRV